MPYKVEPKAQNELKQAIQDKVQDAVANRQVKSLMHDRQSYEFARIKIDSKWLYYNLQNDRTLTKTREFVEENNKPDDYFSEQNFFNIEQQNEYHHIIQEFVNEEILYILLVKELWQMEIQDFVLLGRMVYSEI